MSAGSGTDTWTCPRCGKTEADRFTWAHSPANAPGIRTCGCDPVPTRLVAEARRRMRERLDRAVRAITRVESGGRPPVRYDTPGVGFGLWQMTPPHHRVVPADSPTVREQARAAAERYRAWERRYRG